VRATVSPEKAAELEPVLRNVTPEVTGTLIERTPDHLMLEVPIYGAGGGVSNEVLHNRVEVDVSDLVSLETRTLSKWRTAVVVGAIVAATSSTYLVLSSNNQSGADKPGSGIDNAVISIFRIPLGRGGARDRGAPSSVSAPRARPERGQLFPRGVHRVPHRLRRGIEGALADLRSVQRAVDTFDRA